MLGRPRHHLLPGRTTRHSDNSSRNFSTLALNTTADDLAKWLENRGKIRCKSTHDPQAKCVPTTRIYFRSARGFNLTYIDIHCKVKA